MNREKLEKLNQAIAKMKALIPPEIKLRKELSLEGIWLYIFRHDQLGDIGQMSFQGFSKITHIFFHKYQGKEKKHLESFL